MTTSLLFYALYPAARWDWLWHQAQSTQDVGRREQLLLAGARSLFDTTDVSDYNGQSLELTMNMFKGELEKLRKQEEKAAPPPESAEERFAREQAAAALSELSYDDLDMQDAIIEAGGVPPLLHLIRTGTPLAQARSPRLSAGRDACGSRAARPDRSPPRGRCCRGACSCSCASATRLKPVACGPAPRACCWPAAAGVPAAEPPPPPGPPGPTSAC